VEFGLYQLKTRFVVDVVSEVSRVYILPRKTQTAKMQANKVHLT